MAGNSVYNEEIILSISMSDQSDVNNITFLKRTTVKILR